MDPQDPGRRQEVDQGRRQGGQAGVRVFHRKFICLYEVIRQHLFVGRGFLIKKLLTFSLLTGCLNDLFHGRSVERLKIFGD